MRRIVVYGEVVSRETAQPVQAQKYGRQTNDDFERFPPYPLNVRQHSMAMHSEVQRVNKSSLAVTHTSTAWAQR